MIPFLLYILEGYRSGHNEAVLKICGRGFLQRLKIPCYA